MSYPPPPPPPEDEPGDTPPSYPPPGYSPPGSGGYGGPPSDYGVYDTPKSNPKALWALVIGIVSLPLACYACLGWLGAVAIYLGMKAKGEISASGGRQSGLGQAQAGLVLGWVAVVGGTIVLILNIVLLSTGNISWNYDLGTRT